MAVTNGATVSERLAHFASCLAYDDLPGSVVDAAKLHLLDTLGCGLAAHGVGVGEHARSAMLATAGVGWASVIGSDRRLGPADAALANGTLCHALDFDDTHAGSITHVSTVVCPAALAVAEEVDASGRQLIAAVVAGNEIVIRLGESAAPAYMVTGFHPTSVCGIFGAAAAAGRLLGLDSAGIAHALGIAGSMAAGIFEYLADGTATKPIHAGWAAHGGVLAAQLAAHGATGPSTVLEGRFGVFHAYHRLRAEAIEDGVGDLSERWETPNIAYKPYPACHFIHSALEAVRIATAGTTIEVEEIEEIVVALPEPGILLVCEPRDAKIAPRTEYDAKFSVQYSVAAMLVHGEVGVATYSAERIADARVLELAGRVTCESREFATFPGSFPGALRIRLRNGRCLDADVPHQRGGADNPMLAAEVREKFTRNALLALDGSQSAEFEANVLGIETALRLRGCLHLRARS